MDECRNKPISSLEKLLSVKEEIDFTDDEVMKGEIINQSNVCNVETLKTEDAVRFNDTSLASERSLPVMEQKHEYASTFVNNGIPVMGNTCLMYALTNSFRNVWWLQTADNGQCAESVVSSQTNLHRSTELINTNDKKGIPVLFGRQETKMSDDRSERRTLPLKQKARETLGMAEECAESGVIYNQDHFSQAIPQDVTKQREPLVRLEMGCVSQINLQGTCEQGETKPNECKERKLELERKKNKRYRLALRVSRETLEQKETVEGKEIRNKVRRERRVSRRALAPFEEKEIRNKLYRERYSLATLEEKEIRKKLRSERYLVRRSLETLEEKEIRNKRERERRALRRSLETVEEKEIRRKLDRERQSVRRSLATLEEEEIRNKLDRECHPVSRSLETLEEREIRKKLDRERQSMRRSLATLEEREIRKKLDRECHSVSRSLETLEEREIRKKLDRERHSVSRSRATLEEKEIRKKLDRERHSVSRSLETAERREMRLKIQYTGRKIRKRKEAARFKEILTQNPFKCDDCLFTMTEKLDPCSPNLPVEYVSDSESRAVPCQEGVGVMTAPVEATTSTADEHVCDTCHKSFHSANPTCRLQSLYKLKKLKKRKFLCELCGAVFSEKHGLQNHINGKHASEKKFSCDVCQAKFKYKTSVSMHKRVHTGEKPYVCDICPSKRFTHKLYLKSHMLTHTGEKPWICDICPAKFAWKVSLIEHKRMHTGDKPFTCDVCHEKYRIKQSLTFHRRKHTSH